MRHGKQKQKQNTIQQLLLCVYSMVSLLGVWSVSANKRDRTPDSQGPSVIRGPENVASVSLKAENEKKLKTKSAHGQRARFTQSLRKT